MGKQRKRKNPPSFIVVARTASGGGYPHPIEVGVRPNGADSVLAFSIGPHVVNAGGLVPLGNVLDEHRTGLNPQFGEEFDAAGLDWLVPLLVRLHAGEDVAEEIRSAYQERHGKRPETMY
ncbi:hypothetical protein [Glycomyces terrestris]|uniref:Uncharacterized protein n=1 Tax=Glycomyces terrestris TaxID=2493553 RepID=A0A426V4R0_9ACTN|nr:hypothetical protein [Glycomyces terrestris]RRS01852.1 hypothetical protein EIW28_03660 [Glycomyces terrestris]